MLENCFKNLGLTGCLTLNSQFTVAGNQLSNWNIAFYLPVTNLYRKQNVDGKGRQKSHLVL